MKRMARVTAALLLALGLVASPAAAAEPPIQVLLQGSQIQFDAEPFVENNRTLVPLRALSERLGFKVDWLEAEQRITLTKGDTIVVLWAGKTEATVNGKPATLDVAPQIKGVRTFVPVRFISEHLGAHVFWDGEKRHVRVTPAGQSDPEALTWLNVTPAAPLQRTLTKGEFRFKMTDAAAASTEITGTMQILNEGQQSLSDIAVTAPLFGNPVSLGTIQIATRDGFSWIAMTGKLAGPGAPTGWQPVGAAGGASGTGAVALSPEKLTELMLSLKSQIGVTFGPSEMVGATKLVRIEVDLGDLQFGQLMGALLGPTSPVKDVPKMKAKLSLLTDSESKLVRGITMDATAEGPAGQQGALEIHLKLSIDPTEQLIVWPADLPATPALPAGGAEPMPQPTPGSTNP